MFQNAIKINTFSWSKIVKISFKRKQFFIQLRKELTENYDTLLGFNLANYRSCKNLWKSAVEHHSFFRLHAPPHSVQQNRYTHNCTYIVDGSENLKKSRPKNSSTETNQFDGFFFTFYVFS